MLSVSKPVDQKPDPGSRKKELQAFQEKFLDYCTDEKHLCHT